MDAFVVSKPTANGDLLFLTRDVEWCRDPQRASLYVNRWHAETVAGDTAGRVITQTEALQLRLGVT